MQVPKTAHHHVFPALVFFRSTLSPTLSTSVRASLAHRRTEGFHSCMNDRCASLCYFWKHRSQLVVWHAIERTRCMHACADGWMDGWILLCCGCGRSPLFSIMMIAKLTLSEKCCWEPLFQFCFWYTHTNISKAQVLSWSMKPIWYINKKKLIKDYTLLGGSLPHGTVAALYP